MCSGWFEINSTFRGVGEPHPMLKRRMSSVYIIRVDETLVRDGRLIFNHPTLTHGTTLDEPDELVVFTYIDLQSRG